MKFLLLKFTVLLLWVVSRLRGLFNCSLHTIPNEVRLWCRSNFEGRHTFSYFICAELDKLSYFNWAILLKITSFVLSNSNNYEDWKDPSFLSLSLSLWTLSHSILLLLFYLSIYTVPAKATNVSRLTRSLLVQSSLLSLSLSLSVSFFIFLFLSVLLSYPMGNKCPTKFPRKGNFLRRFT